MKKIVIMSASLILPLVMVMAALITLGNETTPAWKDELYRYLANARRTSAAEPEIQRAVRASRPWNFHQEMSKAIYGGGFTDPAGVNHVDKEIVTLLDWQSWFSETLVLYGGQPLQFPPEDLWCVLLKYRSSSHERNVNGGAYSVVFVALHTDLYTARWLVHESPDEYPTISLERTLATIGCKFK